MELPHLLRTTLATLPARVPYFNVAPAPRPLADPATFLVGVVAAAGNWDQRRNVPTKLLTSLTEVPGVALFNLRPGSDLPGATDLSAPDVLTTASRVRALDLVISVDTMMAHLAGALGVPTWTLLPAQADWRWQEDRADSPWYPTMRLFRQAQPGAWAPVVQQVHQALWERVRGR
jgi:ADP-heptose:LPS heptosyltransferase